MVLQTSVACTLRFDESRLIATVMEGIGSFELNLFFTFVSVFQCLLLCVVEGFRSISIVKMRSGLNAINCSAFPARERIYWSLCFMS